MADFTGTPTYSEGSSNQIVAMFETYEAARAARDALVAAGIDRSRIELLDRGATADDASFNYDRDDEGFWAALKRMFMPDDDSHHYAEGLRRGHALLVVGGPVADHERIVMLLEGQNPIDVETHAARWREAGWTGEYTAATPSVRPNLAATTGPSVGLTTKQTVGQTAAVAATTAAARTTGANHEEVIPVYEEQLRVGKREVGRGSVRVRSYVVEQPVEEQVRLHEERVQVERRPVDRPVTAADVGAGAFRERTIEVTATAEEAVVAKDTRVKEEIVVRKEEQDRTETIRDNVRHTEVEVEDDRATAVTTPTPGATTDPLRRP